MMKMLTGGMIVACMGLSAQVSQKPVVESPVMADFIVPATLRAFIEQSDAVVVARVSQSRDVSRERRPRTEYRMEILNTFKENSNLRATTTICRGIGTIESRERVVKVFEPTFPAFEGGASYLLFLRWDDESRCFWPAFGAPGAATITADSHIEPFVDHPAIQSLKGSDLAVVARHLSEAGRK
jgi:hypothetical protein